MKKTIYKHNKNVDKLLDRKCNVNDGVITDPMQYPFLLTVYC